MQTADPNKVLDGARNGAVSNVQGKLLSELIISLDGYPGREIKVEPAGGKATVICRVYLVKNRLYQALVSTTKENSFSTNVRKFLDSFKLTVP